jgi:hypothetical protein
MWAAYISFFKLHCNPVFQKYCSVNHCCPAGRIKFSFWELVECPFLIRKVVVFLNIYVSMPLQPFVGPWPVYNFLIFYTVGRTPRTGDQPVARPLPARTGQYKHRINVHRQQCLKWASNPRPQCLSERRRFMSQTARPLWSALSSIIVSIYSS